MQPKSEPKQPRREWFQAELEQIIDMHHPVPFIPAAHQNMPE
jgi:hypothetical protein